MQVKQNKRGVWGYDVTLRLPTGKVRHRVFDFATRDEAEEAGAVLLDRARQLRHGLTVPAAQITLAELIAERVPTIASRAERTRSKRVLQYWLDLLPPGIHVQQIEPEHLRKYVNARRAGGVRDATIRRDLNIIGATLHAAGEFFGSLAQWKAPKIPRPKNVVSRRERTITEDEYTRVLAVLTRPAGPLDGNRRHDQQTAYEARLRVAHILQFAMNTAARHSEIVGLPWSAVDWDNNRVLIYQTKTKRYKQIPLTSTVITILRHYQAKPISPKFIFSTSGKIYPKFYKILRRACEIAGVPYGNSNPDGIVLQTARHTVTSRLVQDGNDFDTVGLITGHGAKELIAHYSHHSPQSMARAAQALEKIGGKK